MSDASQERIVGPVVLHRLPGRLSGPRFKGSPTERCQVAPIQWTDADLGIEPPDVPAIRRHVRTRTSAVKQLIAARSPPMLRWRSMSHGRLSDWDTTGVLAPPSSGTFLINNPASCMADRERRRPPAERCVESHSASFP